MRFCRRAVFLILLISGPILYASAQLRNMSQYSRDRINTEQTGFVLHNTGEAEYVWVSEWTHMTAYAAADKAAILVWHFKDGTKAYSQQGEGVGEFGKTTGYLITDKAAELEDVHRRKIQPLSRGNFPVKIELWIGEIDGSTGYLLQEKGDEACFEADAVEYDTPYHFTSCLKAGAEEE